MSPSNIHSTENVKMAYQINIHLFILINEWKPYNADKAISLLSSSIRLTFNRRFICAVATKATKHHLKFNQMSSLMDCINSRSKRLSKNRVKLVSLNLTERRLFYRRLFLERERASTTIVIGAPIHVTKSALRRTHLFYAFIKCSQHAHCQFKTATAFTHCIRAIADYRIENSIWLLCYFRMRNREHAERGTKEHDMNF